jgi:hypothetical protein
LLSCKEFLGWLNEYLDESGDAEVRKHVESHISCCPNCWVIFDTTKKTVQIYKGMDPQPIPGDVQSRLMSALQRRMGGGSPRHRGSA